MGWGKLKKRKGFYIYKRNTNNLGNPNSYPMYIGKIHKKKRLSSIYSKTHIFLGKMSNFIYIYIRKTYTTIWAKYKRKMYRQKSVIFTIGKTLYI